MKILNILFEDNYLILSSIELSSVAHSSVIFASSLTWGSYFGYLIWFSNDDSLLSDEELPYIGAPWTCRAIYLFAFF